jgi:hypothetical protein
MNKQFLPLLLCALAFTLRAQELPKMPTPQKEHEWLHQLVGEWTFEAEASMGPGQPAMKCKGTESVRPLGGFWIIADGNGTVMDQPIKTQFTLGYDPEKKKYVGTWVDSCNNYLWKYEGTLDPTGKILTLDTEGPNPMAAGKMTKFRETLEIKSTDEKRFSSSAQGDDGKYVTFMTATYLRKK